MKALVVDDELFSVQGIVKNLPWGDMGFDEVLEAYSCEQAKEVFRSHAVDLILCDIEMPKGSGIDLMEWVRDNGYRPLCIFLTCYSKFEYASQAVRLQVFDYLLKPAEYSLLEETVRRGVEELSRRKTLERQSSYWTEGYDHLVAQFWGHLVTGVIPGREERIRKELENRHLDPAIGDREYYLTLIRIVPDRESDEWEQGQLAFAVSNVIGDVMRSAAVLRIQPRQVLVIADGEEYPDGEVFEKVCEKLANTLHTVLPAEFLVYYDHPCPVSRAEAVFRGLEEDAGDNLSAKTMVFLHGSELRRRDGLPAIPKGEWSDALYARNTERILEDLRSILYPQDHYRVVDRALLSYLFHSLTDVIYEAHTVSKIAIPGRFFMEENQTVVNKALDSVPDFLAWAEWVLHMAVRRLSVGGASSNALVQVQNYVRDHLDEEINRAILAEAVHLNPDYLSYLFREKTGESLSEFITKERIIRAKHLLANTDLPIRQVAIQSGFSNISYFSKQFKRTEDQTPFQYRKAVQRSAAQKE